MNSSPDNQRFIQEQKEKWDRNFRTFIVLRLYTMNFLVLFMGPFEGLGEQGKESIFSRGIRGILALLGNIENQEFAFGKHK